MQMQFLITFLTLALPICLVAQNGTPAPAGAKGVAMGSTGTAHSGIFALFSNQAGMVQVAAPEIAVFGEQRFLLTDLTILSAGAVVPTATGHFGLQVQQFGIDGYTEQKIGLAYARKLAPIFALGGQIDILHTRITEYGSQTVLTFELGIQSQLLPQLGFSAHVFSPVRVSVSEDYDLPSVLSLGVAYQSSEKLLMVLEVEKDIDHNPAVKGGLEYMVSELFSLRLGGATNPALFSFGLGYQYKQLRLDIASAYHQDLGLMPAFSASYNLGNP